MARKAVDLLYCSSVERCIAAKEVGATRVWITCSCHLLVPSGFGQAESWMEHIFHTVDYCRIHPTLWLIGFNNTQIIGNICGYIVTWCPMVRHQSLVEPRIKAWPCCRTPGVCAASLLLKFVESPAASLSAIVTSSTVRAAGSHSLSVREAAWTSWRALFGFEPRWKLSSLWVTQ